MIATRPDKLICFPPAPLNGGPLADAVEKVGEWVWQPKVDDWRSVLHVPTSTLWNQYGQPSSIAGKFVAPLGFLAVQFGREVEWLDVGMMENRNDLMRGCIIVLDWIESTLRLSARRAYLARYLPTLPIDVSRLLAENRGQVRDAVYLISQWENVENRADALKREAWLKTENEIIGHKFYEGLVAKRAGSLYTFGQRPKQKVADWIKHRFDQ